MEDDRSRARERRPRSLRLRRGDPPRRRSRHAAGSEARDGAGDGASARRAGGARPECRGPTDRGCDRARLRSRVRRVSSVSETGPLAQEGRVRSFVDFYVTTMRTEVQLQFQYRAAIYMYLLGMVAEPVIYLVVWSTIADESGGTGG